MYFYLIICSHLKFKNHITAMVPVTCLAEEVCEEDIAEKNRDVQEW